MDSIMRDRSNRSDINTMILVSSLFQQSFCIQRSSIDPRNVHRFWMYIRIQHMTTTLRQKYGKVIIVSYQKPLRVRLKVANIFPTLFGFLYSFIHEKINLTPSIYSCNLLQLPEICCLRCIYIHGGGTKQRCISFGTTCIKFVFPQYCIPLF